MCKCTPPQDTNCTPSQSKGQFLGQFLLGGLDLEVHLDERRLKKVQLFWQEKVHPDKILATPMHAVYSCDVHLDPMIFIYQLDPCACPQTYVKAFITDRHTHIQTNVTVNITTPLGGWLRSTVVERRSFAGELSLFCA